MWKAARALCWSEATAEQWWRWAGQAARLGHNRVRGLEGGVVAQNCQSSLVLRGRAQSRMPQSQTRDADQRAVEACLGSELVWDEVVEDRDMWQVMEA